MYIYHNFFVHLSVSGHLGFFHVLAILNTAAMNTGIHVSLSVWFPQGICLGVGLLAHMVVLMEKEVATHSSILARRIPRTEELDRPQSAGSQELDTT